MSAEPKLQITRSSERCRFDVLNVGDVFAHRRSGRVLEKRRDGSGPYGACLYSGMRFVFQPGDMVYPCAVVRT